MFVFVTTHRGFRQNDGSMARFQRGEVVLIFHSIVDCRVRTRIILKFAETALEMTFSQARFSCLPPFNYKPCSVSRKTLQTREL